MSKIYILILIIPISIFAIDIKQLPINFNEKRVELTKRYIKSHYEMDVKDIKIVPKIVVVHHTAIDDFEESLLRFTSDTLPTDREDISGAGSVNVSTHFMIERDGTINQLMPLDIMGRHVIGLNYSSIGIENVGGESSNDNLTDAQLKSNIELIKELKNKLPTIEYVIGHYEYRCFENHPLWLEKDKKYRTQKNDPSIRFMSELRANIDGLKKAPCKSVDD